MWSLTEERTRCPGISVRENAFTKARRYLTEGRLLVVSVTEDRISALCRGDGQIYNLELDPRGWHCDCPAVTDQCAHLRALRMVTIAKQGGRGQ